MNKVTVSYYIFILISLCTTSIRAQGNLDTRSNVPRFKCSFDEGQEPNLHKALQRWPDQQNMWTPIGWKDHYSRFNVIYNGAIILDPAPGFSPRQHSKQWLVQIIL